MCPQPLISELVANNVPKLALSVRVPHRFDKGRLSPPHYHDELELLPVNEGRLRCTVNGVDYIAEAGEVVFINSRVPHSTYGEEDGSYSIVQFREKDFVGSDVSKIIRYSLRFKSLSDSPVRIVRSAELFETLTQLLKEIDEGQEGFVYYARSGIYRILGWLYRNELLSSAEQMFHSPSVGKLIPALDYINANFAENISLSEVCDLVGFEQSYFCRVFKNATGATFTEYLNFVRICKAENLLAKTDKSVLEISEADGFSSVSYFNRTFKKYLCCSPKTYRNAKYIAIYKGERENTL